MKLLFTEFLICLFFLSDINAVASNKGENIAEKTNVGHPSTDLALRPFEGETIWAEPEKIRCDTYLSCDGVMKEFPYDASNGYYITRSGWNDPRDCFTIRVGLRDHNMVKIGIKGEKHIFIADPSTKTPIAFINSHSESLNIDPDHFRTKRDLSELLSSSYMNGARRAYAMFAMNYNEPNDVLDLIKVKLPTMNNFYKMGFSMVESMDSLHDESTNILLVKGLSAEDSHSKPSHQWQAMENKGAPLEEYAHKFGFFVRNKNGKPIGALIGFLFKGRSNLSCAEIDIFYMSPDIRGKGYGKRLMQYTENFLQSQSVQASTLSTFGFQAPWFYEKWEYRRTLTIPKVLRWREGLTSVYFYEKRFSE